MALDQFIKEIANDLASLEKEQNLAYWKLATTGLPEHSETMKKAQIAQKKLLSSKEKLEKLRAFPVSHDLLLERQRTLLGHAFMENQINPLRVEEMVELEVSIENCYTTFRAPLDGKLVSNNDIQVILKTSTDSELRRKAWEASKKIGEEVEPMMRKLISLRNQSAIEAGFSDYYTMRLKLQEIEPEFLEAFLEDLDSKTRPLWQRYKSSLDLSLRKRYDEKDLCPWHYADPFFQEAPQEEVNWDLYYQNADIIKVSEAFFEDVGLPVGEILSRSDLFERDKKNQHAFCTHIDRSGDVRILCNLRPSEYWMGTQLHELGHAVYDQYLDFSLPFLLRAPAHIAITEAVAMLFGRFSKNTSFLKKYIGIDGVKTDSSNLLVFARWVLVMCHFEKKMYQEASDLNLLWWDLVEKFQMIKKVAGRDLPDWASKLHLACAPVYYQNYIIGECAASQLMASIGDPFCSPKEVGSFLKEKLFKLGSVFPWDKTLEIATGVPATEKSLNISYFVNDISF